jgi:lipoate-protein ligase A
MLEKAINVTMIGGETVSWEKAAQAIAAGFEEALNVEFTAGKLTPSELNRAQNLMDEKYQNPSWTHRL